MVARAVNNIMYRRLLDQEGAEGAEGVVGAERVVGAKGAVGAEGGVGSRWVTPMLRLQCH